MWKCTGSEPPSKKDALKKATKRIKASLRRHRQKKCSKIHIYIHTLFVYQYTKIAYAMCDLNQNMKQKKQKKKQKKNRKKYCQTDVGQRAHSGVQIFYEVASL